KDDAPQLDAGVGQDPGIKLDVVPALLDRRILQHCFERVQDRFGVEMALLFRRERGHIHTVAGLPSETESAQAGAGVEARRLGVDGDELLLFQRLDELLELGPVEDQLVATSLGLSSCKAL